MPKPRPIIADTDDWTPLPLHGPFGGLNLRDDPRSLTTESPDLLNVDITEDGIVKTDLGYTVEGNVSGTDAVTRVFSAYKSDGTKFELRSLGTKIQYNNAGTWTDIATGLTAGKIWDFVVVNDIVYMVNGFDTPRKWTFTGNTSTVGTIDQGTTIDFMNDRLWTAGVDASRINFSAQGDYENFPAGGDIECWKKDGAGSIVALRHLGRQQIVFKERQKYGWDALVFSTLEFRPLGQQSTTALRSIVSGDDGYQYFANRDGAWRHRGTSQDDYLSGPVEPEFQAMDQSKEANMAAEWFQREYWLAYTPSGQTVNTKVLRLKPRTGDWLLKDWKVGCFCVFIQSDGKKQLVFGSSLSDSTCFKRYLDDVPGSYNHNGVAITAYYVNAFKAPSGRHGRNRWAHCFYQFDPALAAYFATLGWRSSTIGGFREEPVNLAPTTRRWTKDGTRWTSTGKFWPGLDIIEGYLKTFNAKSRGLQFRIKHVGINEPFRFLGVTPHFQRIEGYK
jgi:hypothetical protein